MKDFVIPFDERDMGTPARAGAPVTLVVDGVGFQSAHSRSAWLVENSLHQILGFVESKLVRYGVSLKGHLQSLRRTRPKAVGLSHRSFKEQIKLDFGVRTSGFVNHAGTIGHPACLPNAQGVQEVRSYPSCLIKSIKVRYLDFFEGLRRYSSQPPYLDQLEARP